MASLKRHLRGLENKEALTRLRAEGKGPSRRNCRAPGSRELSRCEELGEGSRGYNAGGPARRGTRGERYTGP